MNHIISVCCGPCAEQKCARNQTEEREESRLVISLVKNHGNCATPIYIPVLPGGAISATYCRKRGCHIDSPMDDSSMKTSSPLGLGPSTSRKVGSAMPAVPMSIAV